MERLCIENFEVFLQRHCENNGHDAPAQSIPYFDIWGEDTPIDFLFSYKGNGVFARGDIHTIKGREKMGKSAAGIIYVASALGGEFASVEASHDITKVLWVDTEQSDAVLRKRVQETLRMSDATDEALQVIALRGLEPSERLKMTISAIADAKPDFVFLDGVVDLCNNFNDNEECAKVVDALLKATKQYGCAIVGVIHTNKKDTEARGHLGTILQQKSAEIYEVTKDDAGIATMKQSRSRFADVPPLRFKFLDGFRLEGAESIAEERRNEERERFASILAGGKAMRNAELTREYCGKYGYRERTAQSHIKQAYEHGVLYKDEAGLYTYLFPLFEDCNEVQNEFDDDDI